MFIQIIEGKVEIVIDKKFNMLNIGEFIIILVYVNSMIKVNICFKMFFIIIKSGYEE